MAQVKLILIPENALPMKSKAVDYEFNLDSNSQAFQAIENPLAALELNLLSEAEKQTFHHLAISTSILFDRFCEDSLGNPVTLNSKQWGQPSPAMHLSSQKTSELLQDWDRVRKLYESGCQPHSATEDLIHSFIRLARDQKVAVLVMAELQFRGYE